MAKLVFSAGEWDFYDDSKCRYRDRGDWNHPWKWDPQAGIVIAYCYPFDLATKVYVAHVAKEILS